MEGRIRKQGSIETLSIFFTTGIAAGTALCPSYGAAAPEAWFMAAGISFDAAALALTITCSIRALKKSAAWMAALYFTIGIFCACSDALGTCGCTGSPCFLKSCAEEFAFRCRALISTIPFPHTNSSGLINALLTGDKSCLDKSVVTAFRNSGAAHILALSGLHLGIIYGILRKMTAVLGNSRTAVAARSTAVISASVFYTVACGSGASLTRALLFIIINEITHLTHRRAKPARVYCTALLIQLTLSPHVIGTVSFQLSYLAMAGIFFLHPALKGWFPEGNGLMSPAWISRKMWNAMSIAISCQIFTGPASWFYFGTFPKYFIIANLMALPVTSLLMTSATATVALHAAGICPQFMISVTDGLATTLIFITDTIAGI